MTTVLRIKDSKVWRIEAFLHTRVTEHWGGICIG